MTAAFAVDHKIQKLPQGSFCCVIKYLIKIGRGVLIQF